MRTFLLIIFILPYLCYSAKKDMELSGTVDGEVYESYNFWQIDTHLYDYNVFSSVVISLEANESFHLMAIAALEADSQLTIDTDGDYLFTGSHSGRTYTNSLDANPDFGYNISIKCSSDGYSTQFKSLKGFDTSFLSVDDGYLATLYGPGDIMIRGGIREYAYVQDNANPSFAKLQGTASLKLRLFYEVSKAGSTPSEEKFSVALDDDGSRLAIGTKDGTNTLVRVYEYDGSSWSQLGEDVEQ